VGSAGGSNQCASAGWVGRAVVSKGKLLRAMPYFHGQFLAGLRQDADLGQESHFVKRMAV
jgi:hypothetical protein